MLRPFKVINGTTIIPDSYIAARIKCKDQIWLPTNEIRADKTPYIEARCDAMVQTTKAIMRHSGLRIVYGYPVGNEINLIIKPEENMFGRHAKNMYTLLVSLATAYYNMYIGNIIMGNITTFDCDVWQFPHRENVVDYLRLRMSTAQSKAMHRFIMWSLIAKIGLNAANAELLLANKDIDFKTKLLAPAIDLINKEPAHVICGVGITRHPIAIEGVNQLTGEVQKSSRARLETNYDLRTREGYTKYLKTIL